MADLRDREVAVDFDKNRSTMGPSGRRARSKDSAYLLVGGSSDIYTVTVNFESAQGHWCEKESGARCHGNGNGKTRTYGKPSERDKHDPNHWCKHVQAALADTEKLAQAQDISAQAFGQRPAKVTVKVADPVPAFPDHTAPVNGRREAIAKQKASAKARLSVLDTEREALQEEIRMEEDVEINAAILALVKQFGEDRIAEAVKRVA